MNGLVTRTAGPEALTFFLRSGAFDLGFTLTKEALELLLASLPSASFYIGVGCGVGLSAFVVYLLLKAYGSTIREILLNRETAALGVQLRGAPLAIG